MITGGTLLSLAAIAAVSFAVMAGPFMLATRAGLRLIMPASDVKRWQGPVAMGLRSGAVMASLACAFVLGPVATGMVAVLILLLLLAGLDLAWRWLPFEWTLPLLALAFAMAAFEGNLGAALTGMAVGGGMLFALQLYFRLARGVTALGTGDIWLAAGLGTLSGMPVILYILTLAALSGLLGAGFARFRTTRQRYGVAFGTHLSLAYFIFLLF
ncbi:type IV leader peptidase family protein [Yoonia maricola]|uniref:Type IV leader peptidase family protein n=1 Tax=Yoonia maricola TaxID=420999 RepID=A0A2M8W1Z5_9RHOB|nr:prepilin peptidase [Yoonia maricola]PJI84928.1 type IV leader peptidase family protein [Yoonia maricola]